jgi:amidase
MAETKVNRMQLVGQSATRLAGAVRDGEVTAVEVVRAHLNHLAAVEHRLGAFVSVRRRSALEEAEAVDAREDRNALPLAGVPIAITDNLDVAGEPTRHGSAATSDELAKQDDEVVRLFREAGAIVIGKTRCPELSIWGATDSPQGIAVSPWDPTRSAGGSSGGSGAAVAAGVVPIALGTDGMGSVRVPAAANGILGMRPGAGMAPLLIDGEPHWYGMTRYGPLATTVEDLALAMDIIAGTDHLREPADPPSMLRVAVSFKPPAPGVVVNSAWREAALEAGRLLNHAGHDVHRSDPPYDPSSMQAIIARWTQGVARDVERLGLDRDQLQARTRSHLSRGEQFARVRPVDAEDAINWRVRLAPFFDEHDLLITPTFARVQLAASEWHTKTWVSNVAGNLSAYPFTFNWNLADLPAVVVPLWHDGGRPLSVQIVAGEGREDLVLAVARLFESMVPWERHAPGWEVPGTGSKLATEVAEEAESGDEREGAGGSGATDEVQAEGAADEERAEGAADL